MGKPLGKLPLGRQMRWGDVPNMDICETGCEGRRWLKQI